MVRIQLLSVLYLFLISGGMISCNHDRRKSEITTFDRAKQDPGYPKEIMHDVYWGFYGERYSSFDEFVAAVTKYHTDLDKIWNSDEIVLNCKEVTVLFTYWSSKKEEDIEEDFVLRADDDYFTAGELLFKIHNHVVEKLGNDDRHFFEGLILFEDSKNVNTGLSVPYYILNQGS